MNYLFTYKNFSKHKRRFDRGGTYQNYIMGLGTVAIFVEVSNIDKWWVYVLGFLLLFTYRYVMGYFDEKKKILSHEQDGYNKENPFVQRVLQDLEQIKNKMNVL